MPEAWLSDTDPQSREVYLNLFRAMTPGERVSRVFELCAFQQSLQESNVLRVAARRVGRELMIAAYGWDPDLYP
jgi:uncharacterized membrane-anchored protein